jgi:ribonuclease E
LNFGEKIMAKRILVDATYPQETRVVLLNDNNQIEELEYETSNKQQIKGNIYLAKIVRIEPSLQAAFIEYGHEKNGFLPFSEIHPVYYHIPSSDRDKISADLQSINRPNITQKDIADADKKQDNTNPDADLLSLDGESDEVEIDEVLESDDEAEKPKSGKENPYSQYKIQDVIKKGQIILVQAEKESRGNKGASFTSFISLAGKYCVLMPNSGGHNGI